MEEKSLHKNSNIKFLAIVCLGFVLGASEFSVIGTEIEMAQSYGISVSKVGNLISYFAVTYAIFTPILALTTYRIKRIWLMVAYLIIFNLGNLLCMVSNSFELMLVARAMMGATSGGALAVGMTVVPEVVEEKHIPMAISTVYAGFSVALIICTSVGRYISANFGWRLLYILVFAVGLATSIFILITMPKTGKTDEPSSFKEQMRFLLNGRVLVCVFVFIFGVGSVYTLYGYITPYMEGLVGLKPSQTATVLVVYGVFALISTLGSGVLDMKLGYRGLIPNFLCLSGVLFAVWLAGDNTVMSIIMLFGVATFMYTVSTPCVTMFIEQANKYAPGALTMAVSMEPLSFNIGIAFGTACGGTVLATYGLSYLPLAGSILTLMALLCVLINLAIQRNRDKNGR